MHQNRLSPGSARTRWGSLQRSPRPPLAAFDGLASQRKEKRVGERGRKGEERCYMHPLWKIPSYATVPSTVNFI